MQGRFSYGHRLSHPYYAGTEHVGCSPTRQALLAPSVKGREVFGESHMKGELHPSENLSRKDGLGHLVPTFLLVDDSDQWVTLFSGVATPETAMGITMTLPRGRLTIFTLPNAIIPLVRR